LFERNGDRNEATGPAKHLGTAGGEADDGIVATAKNVAVVHQESIGDTLEAADSFGVVDGDGLFAEVGAGHDEGIAFTAGQQEVVKRGVRKKDTEEAIARGEAFDQAGVRPTRQEDDGTLNGEEKFFCGIVNFAEAFRILDAAEHDGEGFFDAAFAFAESVDGGFRAGVAGEVKSAEALYGDDVILFKKLRGFAQWFGDILQATIGGPELNEGAAVPAGIWLRVKPAVGGIVVFGLAGGAHGERSHGGAGAVVGNVTNDGEAWAAVGTVDEGIAEAAVARIHHFAKTIAADCDIGGNEGFGRGVEETGEDTEGGFRLRFCVTGKKFRDSCEGRKLGGQALEETIDQLRFALNFDGDASGAVGDEAGKIAFVGETIDKGAESDALDDAGDIDGFPSEKRFVPIVHLEIIAELAGIDSRGGRKKGEFRRRVLSSDFRNVL